MRVGIVALIGRPNVGKSSLMNAILDQDIAIVTPKPQTTRDAIRGVLTNEHAQIVFTDTPGIHKAHNQLGLTLNKVASYVVKDSEVALYLFDASMPWGRGDEYLVTNVVTKATKVAVITKIDLITPEEIKYKVSKLKAFGFNHIWGVSIFNKTSLQHFIDNLVPLLPEGDLLYEPELVTDQSMRFIAKEVIREVAILLLSDELPYGIAVVIDDFVETYDVNEVGDFEIAGTIFVERESQKGILIGKGGQMIKMIGTKARLKLETLFNAKIFLKLRVKVKPKWTSNIQDLKKLGYF